MATKKRAKRGTPNKAEFVRKFPDASAQEVVEEAKKAGIEIPVQYVYNVRGADRTAAKKSKRAGKKGSAKKRASTKAVAAPKKAAATNGAAASATNGSATKTTAPAPSRSSASAKDRFISAMLEIGIERASRILEVIRSA